MGSSSDREAWQKIYTHFAQMIKSEQNKARALLEERDYLIELMNLKEEQYNSSMSLAQLRINQMKEMDGKTTQYFATKFNVLVAQKDEEISLYKKYSELNENDLEEYHKRILSLRSEISNLKKKLESSETELNPELKKQIKDKENELLSIKENNKYIWAQFKEKENYYNALLKNKQIELDKAYEEVNELKKSLEEKEASVFEIISKYNKIVKEKDEIISKLNASRSVQETGTSRTLRSRTRKNLEENEKGERSHADVAENADVAGASKNLRSRTRNILEESEEGASRTVPETGTRTLRSGMKRSFEVSSSIMVACSNSSRRKTSESNYETPKLFSGALTVPKTTRL